MCQQPLGEDEVIQHIQEQRSVVVEISSQTFTLRQPTRDKTYLRTLSQTQALVSKWGA